MASGGSVVGAQFLGSGDKKTACHAAEQLVMICGLIALVICGISFFGNRWILRVVYGSVEEQVMAYAVEYFFITSLSFPFLGIYNAGAALFRVMGNSNISMVTSIVMNALNIIGNAVFVFGFDMKVIANSRHKKTGPQYDGVFQHAAVFQILEFRTDEGRSFARFAVLEIDHKERLAVHFDTHADLDVSCCNCHRNMVYNCCFFAPRSYEKNPEIPIPGATARCKRPQNGLKALSPCI